MPDMPSITIVKRMSYRGQNEEWSNKYHFSGTTPADATAWKTLADAIITNEKGCLPATISFVRAYGYVAGQDHTVAVIDYTLPPNTVVVGTQPTTSASPTPGDAAFWIRWQTPDFNSRGKRIYLRKYYHGALYATGTPDLVSALQVSNAVVVAGKFTDGTLPGSFKYCGPQGAVATNPTVGAYVTTRTLKRRGKRPPR